MDHIGIDVHKKESQICILAEYDRIRRLHAAPQQHLRGASREVQKPSLPSLAQERLGPELSLAQHTPCQV